MTREYIIAVDSMGGDYAPRQIVLGVKEALKKYNITALLVGDTERIRAELKTHKMVGNPHIRIISAQGVIEEYEHPANAYRRKKNSSVGVAVRLVRDRIAHGMISFGNSGATLFAAQHELGLIVPLKRACIGGPFPLAKNVVIVDAGANVDCSPELFCDLARTGAALAKAYHGIVEEHPKIGILSNGGEETKGNKQTRAALGILQETELNLIGYVEPADILSGRSNPKAHVVVCDGFVGNLLLKTLEAARPAAARHIRERVAAKVPHRWHIDSLVSVLVEKLIKAGLNNPAQEGGALVLGVNGIAIIGHGSSKAPQVAQAIGTAVHALDLNLIENMQGELEKLAELQGSPI